MSTEKSEYICFRTQLFGAFLCKNAKDKERWKNKHLAFGKKMSDMIFKRSKLFTNKSIR